MRKRLWAKGQRAWTSGGPRLIIGELGQPKQKSRPPATHLLRVSPDKGQRSGHVSWWPPPCREEGGGGRGRGRKLGLEVSWPEGLLPVCWEVTASENCSGERREAMVTSGKLAKGPRPPSLCPHGACWPWLKIVQFLCCHRAQPKRQRAAGCCLWDSRVEGTHPTTAPPQFGAAGPHSAGRELQRKQVRHPGCKCHLQK